MSRRPNPPFSPAPFGLLLVEGAVCEAVAGAGAWAHLRCWCASGQTDLPALGALAAADPNARFSCAGSPRTNQARGDKGWLKAYLGMLPDPSLRFHQSFSIADGIDPEHASFDPLRRFLLAL